LHGTGAEKKSPGGGKLQKRKKVGSEGSASYGKGDQFYFTIMLREKKIWSRTVIPKGKKKSWSKGGDNGPKKRKHG